jgi:hypothetical protein
MHYLPRKSLAQGPQEFTHLEALGILRLSVCNQRRAIKPSASFYSIEFRFFGNARSVF